MNIDNDCWQTHPGSTVPEWWTPKNPIRCEHLNCHVPASRPDKYGNWTCGNHDEDRPSEAQFIRELENEMGCEPFGPIDKD